MDVYFLHVFTSIKTQMANNDEPDMRGLNSEKITLFTSDKISFEYYSNYCAGSWYYFYLDKHPETTTGQITVIDSSEGTAQTGHFNTAVGDDR